MASADRSRSARRPPATIGEGDRVRFSPIPGNDVEEGHVVAISSKQKIDDHLRTMLHVDTGANTFRVLRCDAQLAPPPG